MTTPTIVAVETAAIVYDGAWSHTTSASGQAGDVIALVHFTQGGGGADMSEPTSPSGSWTQRQLAAEGGWAPAIKLWTRPAPTGTFTVTIPAVGASGHQGVIFLLRSATETPEATAESSGDSTSGHITPSVSATTTDALILRAIATRGGDSATYTWPSSTERTDTAAGSGGAGGVFSTATKAATASGGQGTETCTGSAVTNWGEYIGLTAAFGGAGGTDATVTPGVIAATVSLPASARSLGATATPAAIASTAALPASARSAGATLQPTAVAAVAALPAAAASAGSTVTPAAVTLAASLPAATVTTTGSATVQPASIATSTLLPAATPAAGATATPATTAVVAALPAAAAAASSTVTPATIAAISAIPLSNLLAASTVLPATIAAAVTLPQVAVNADVRDLQLTLGRPETKWYALTPSTRWVAGVAETTWQTGNPAT